MKTLILVTALLIGASAFARQIGNQYDYLCESENGEFNVQVITSEGKRTFAKVGDQETEPYSITFKPRLGANEVRLYFDGAPGEDEPYNVCKLTYTNAH